MHSGKYACTLVLTHTFCCCFFSLRRTGLRWRWHGCLDPILSRPTARGRQRKRYVFFCLANSCPSSFSSATSLSCICTMTSQILRTQNYGLTTFSRYAAGVKREQPAVAVLPMGKTPLSSASAHLTCGYWQTPSLRSLTDIFGFGFSRHWQ